MIKTKKQMFIVICSCFLIILLGTTSYALFNYTKTGTSNVIKVGKVLFNSGQSDTIMLTNASPISRQEALTDNNNAGEVIISVSGETTFDEGLEYVISIEDAHIQTSTAKNVPIGIIVTPEIEGELGTANTNYFNNNVRGGNTSYYKVLADEIVKNGEYVFVGYIRPGVAEINGTIGIRAFIDRDRIIVSNTYNKTLDTNNNQNDDKIILTTQEWNSFNSNSISFKVRVHANEGIWVGEPLSRNDIENIVYNTTITNAKSTITEINFIRMTEEMINLHSNLIDLTASGGNGMVKGWIDGTKLYIASPGETYLPAYSSGFFSSFTNVTRINFDNINTSLAEDMSGLFSDNSSLTSVDFSYFDTTSLTDIEAMFFQCTHLVNINFKNFDTSRITNMSKLFSGCSSLTSLDLSHFNTEHVTRMQYMFAGCSSLTSLDLSNFNTHYVYNMESMFNGCVSLTSLDVSNFETGVVENMRGMFYNCIVLASLDLSSFNTQSVETMSQMFTGCTSLTSLDLSNFRTGSVTNMNSMFWHCHSLTSLDLSSFDTSIVEDMSGMFANCPALRTIDLSSFDLSSLSGAGGMFYGDENLVTIYVGNVWNAQNVSISNEMFMGCTSIVGGSGTTYDANYTNNAYARVDGGAGNRGYLTLKTV